jgi:hypothetical protein
MHLKEIKMIRTIIMAALLAVSMNVSANNVLKYKTPGGWMFDTPQGERLCITTGNGLVECLDVAGNEYLCAYEDPPKYFSNCGKMNRKD